MVAFYLPGGIPIYAFSLLLAVGVFLGLAWVVLRAPQATAAMQAEAGLWALAGALVAGRAAHVALAWPYYQDHIGEAFQVNLGGLAWPGALAGSILVLVVYARLSRQPFGLLADSLTPLLAAIGVAAWLGCLIDGCGYGPPSQWIGIASPDEWGTVAVRWPVQTFSALLILAIFWLVDRLPETRPALAGMRASLLLLGLAIVQFAATLLSVQSDSWRSLPVDAWAALTFAGLALMTLGIIYRSGQVKPNEDR
jgi:prolipoprotein diacylglyceryltransferase